MKIFSSTGHLQDEALLLLDEDAMRGGVTRSVESHLLSCSACRQRQQVLREADQELQADYEHVELPLQEGARIHLQAGLRAEATSQPGTWRWRAGLSALLQPAFLLRVGMAMALLVVAVTWRQAGRPLQDLMAAYEETGPKPNHALTPGSASVLSVAEVCRLSDDDLDPKLSPEKQSAVFHAYRMDEDAAKAYQVDYLINPQLGGDDSLKNLWPEPYQATIWNATTKDALEAKLHSMVCNQQIDLRAAQQELADDWIAAYKKYFHASRPVRTVAAIDTRTPR